MLHRPGVIDLLAAQHWVASIRQLESLGVTRQRVAQAVAAALVVRVTPGVVGIDGHCDSFEGRATALVLGAPPGSFLSGTTAGRLHGLRRMPETPVEITIPQRRRFTTPAWARVVRTSWSDDVERVERSHGLVVASPLRTLFALAAHLPEPRFRQAAEDARHRQLVTPRAARAYLAGIRRQGRTGVARFERWLEQISSLDAPATTGLELLLIDLARQAGLPEPVRQHPLHLPTGAVIHLDLAWPDIRFAIEPGHSWWHGGDRAQREDQARDRACSAAGWHVVRFDESVWQQRTVASRQIHAMYHARARDVA